MLISPLKTVPLLLFIALAALRLGAAEIQLAQVGKDEVNSILATVNGEPISLYDIMATTRNEEFQACAALSGKALQDKIMEIRKKAVDSAIDRQLIYEDFLHSGLQLKNHDIEAEIDAAAARMGVVSRSEFAKKLTESGSSPEKFRQELIRFMAIQLMLYRQFNIDVSVTPRDIHEYYQNNPQKFTEPAQVGLAMILLAPDTQKLDEVVENIKKSITDDPDRFARLAEDHTSGPGRTSGGYLGLIEVGRLRSEFAAAIDDFTPGKCFGPIDTADGKVFLKVISFRPAKNIDFADAAPGIKSTLENELREASRKRYIESLRRDAVIRYYFPE